MGRAKSRKVSSSDQIEPAFRLKQRKPIPYEFVLDALSPISPWTRPMFGCTAVYVGDKIVFALRDKPTYPRDNGVWIATTREHHASLRNDFPNMRTIALLGEEVGSWQVLPIDSPDFEESVMRACELICAGDQRIGKIPGAKRKARTRYSSKPSSTKTTRP